MGVRGEVNFLFVSDRVIRRYNFNYLKHDYATDVIAFEGVGKTFGDIVISSDMAARQARKQRHSYERELKILVIHGLLHLSGYDDHKKKDEEKMWQKTWQLLSAEK